MFYSCGNKKKIAGAEGAGVAAVKEIACAGYDHIHFISFMRFLPVIFLRFIYFNLQGAVGKKIGEQPALIVKLF